MGDIEEWGMLFTEDADYTTETGAGWHGRAEIVESGRLRRGWMRGLLCGSPAIFAAVPWNRG